MKGSGEVPVYVCSQCGDVLVGDEWYSKGKDDCDEGYVKYELPLALIRALKSRGILEALTGVVMAADLKKLPADPLEAFDWVLDIQEKALKHYAKALLEGECD